MELQQLIEKWEKEIAKVNITDEDESGKWYENEWSHGRYGAISEFLADVKQLNLPPVCKCPLCGEEMIGIELTHYKCKKCNEYFTN